MHKNLHFVLVLWLLMAGFKWRLCLLIEGVCQLLLSILVIVSGSVSYAGCKHYFYINWGLVISPFLIFNSTITIIAYKLSSQRLLSVIGCNALVSLAAAAAALSGGLGLFCIIQGDARTPKDYAAPVCYDFAQRLGCKNNNFAKTAMQSRYQTDLNASKANDGMLMASGVILSFLCVGAALTAYRVRTDRRSNRERKDPKIVFTIKQQHTKESTESASDETDTSTPSRKLTGETNTDTSTEDKPTAGNGQTKQKVTVKVIKEGDTTDTASTK